MYSQAISVVVGILVDFSDSSEFFKGTVIEARNSSLEYLIANKGTYIAKDLVLIIISNVKLVKRVASHSGFNLIEA